MASKPRLAELVSIFVWFRSGACSDPGIVAASETTLVDIGQHMLRGANHSGRSAQAIGLNPAPLQHDAISQAAHDRAQVLLQEAAQPSHEFAGQGGRKWQTKKWIGGGGFGDVWSAVEVGGSGGEKEFALKMAKSSEGSGNGSESSADMDTQAGRYLTHEIRVMTDMAKAAPVKCGAPAVLLVDSNEGQPIPFYVMTKMLASLGQSITEPPQTKQAKKMSADPELNFLSLPLFQVPHLDVLKMGRNTDTSEVRTDSCFSKVADELIRTLICFHRGFNLVHGDLKDDNILYGRLEGQCPEDFKLADFGLTKTIGQVVDKLASSTTSFHLPAAIFASKDDHVEQQPTSAFSGVDQVGKYKVVVDIDYCSAAFLIRSKFGDEAVEKFGSKLALALTAELADVQSAVAPEWLPAEPKLKCGRMGSDHKHIELDIPGVKLL